MVNADVFLSFAKASLTSDVQSAAAPAADSK
jgi:hypothetical protein